MLRRGDDRNIRVLIARHGDRRGAAVTSLSLGLSPARRVVLGRRIRFLVAATISYNVIEAVVALTAGAQASSSALIGFGLDSVIEVCSAAAVARECAGRGPGGRGRGCGR